MVVEVEGQCLELLASCGGPVLHSLEAVVGGSETVVDLVAAHSLISKNGLEVDMEEPDTLIWKMNGLEAGLGVLDTFQ
jgi:hypothetical protein